MQAASATSQLNGQLADALAKVLSLETDKTDMRHEMEKLEDQVAYLQASFDFLGVDPTT